MVFSETNKISNKEFSDIIKPKEVYKINKKSMESLDYLPLEKIKQFLNLISCGESITEEVLKAFRNVGIELVESVLDSAVELAKLKDDKYLKAEDIQLIFLKKHNIKIPPLSFIPNYITRNIIPDENSLHLQRLAQIRFQKTHGFNPSRNK